MPQIKQIIQPQKVIERNSIGNYFADFGNAAFGALRVQIDSQNADSVVVHLGEKLEAPGLVKRNPGGTIRYRFIGLKAWKRTQSYTLNIPPIPRHLKYPAITMPAKVGEVTPFRYCEIESHSHSTICKSVNWPIDERDGNEMPEVNTVVNAFHYESLRLMAENRRGRVKRGFSDLKLREDQLFS